jgi:hypothetical protein
VFLFPPPAPNTKHRKYFAAAAKRLLAVLRKSC